MTVPESSLPDPDRPAPRRLESFAASLFDLLERAAVLTLGTVALVLAAQAGGGFAPETGRLFGVLLLVAVALTLTARRRLGAVSWGVFLLGLVLSMSAAGAGIWLGAFAVALAGLALAPGASQRDLLGLAAGGILAAVGWATVVGAPALGAALSRLSLAYSTGFGSLGGEPLVLGPSASGLWPLLVVAAAAVGQRLSRCRSPLHAVAALIAWMLAAAVFLGVVSGVPAGLPQSAHAIASRQWIAGLLAVPVVWLAAAGAPRTRSPQRWQSIVAAAAVAIPIFVLVLVPEPKRGGGRVLLLDEGFIDWEVPEYGKYGPYQTGLFGMLPDYLRLSAFQPRIAPGPVEPALLDGADALVIINPQAEWSAAEMEAIWGFVRRGGGLLVLGDHTNLMGTQNSLDQLLAPSGISFRFDSGFPCREAWWHGLAPLRHPAVAGIGSWSEALISVGATLDLTPPAYPVVWGRYGFSDLGNRLNEQGAYLGDYLYQRGEQLGEVVLAASAAVGKGRVLVLGDTSPLQNLALPLTFEPFVVPMMRWLCDPGAHHAKSGLAGLLLALAGLAGVWRVAGDGRATAALGAAAFAACGLALWLSHPSPVEPEGAIAWVDLAHSEDVTLGGQKDDGLNAVMTTLARSRYLPLLRRRIDAGSLEHGKLFLTIAPMRPFEEREVDALEGFARGGGLIVVAAGWQQRHGSAPLLARFGLRINPVPLGPVPVVREDPALVARSPIFVDAWAIQALPGPAGGEEVTFVPAGTGAAGPAATSGQRSEFDRVLYQTEGFTVAGFRRLGRGGLLLIGDRQFLGDGNLENLRYHREGNILFLRDALRAAGS